VAWGSDRPRYLDLVGRTYADRRGEGQTTSVSAEGLLGLVLGSPSVPQHSVGILSEDTRGTPLMEKPDVIYSIFVSSTSEDLTSYRARARDVILVHNLRLLGMEYFPAEAGGTKDALGRYIDAADAVVLIVGARYGSLADDRRSFVEWEFEQALKRSIPVVCLILSEDQRNKVEGVSPEERAKQESFIQRLKAHLKVAEFDSHNFDRVLGGALNLLPRQLGKSAGLIPMTNYEFAVESAWHHRSKLEAHETFLRLLSVIGMMYKHSEYRWGNDHSMKKKGELDRAVFDNFLDLLYQDIVDQPVTTQILGNVIRRLIERLHGFSGPAGFVPESLGELEASIDELFSRTLSTLKATSIYSSHETLLTHQSHWEDGGLGPFLRRKNRQFLTGEYSGRVLWVYACDSLANSAAESWFRETVIEQVRQGALVKVVEIDFDDLASYEDFGIYEHQAGGQDSGTYLLLAHTGRNAQGRHPSTAVIADRATVTEYSRKFDTLWRRSVEPLEILTSSVLEQADVQQLATHGEGKIENLFGRRIVLRRMQRLDTRERLLPTSTKAVRKYEPVYAKAISDHLRTHFPGTDHILYIGDTHKNDGTAIRNLQALGWNVSGFICEPKLGLARIWFNGILYTNQWTDLVGLAEKVQSKIGQHTMAIFEIDQTLWGPKGVHDAPLSNTRTRAMSRLIDEYIAGTNGEVANRAKARLELLYREISEVKYINSLTLDNEDYKAAICVFLALNIVFDQPRLDRSGREGGAAFFEELGRLEAEDFLERMKEVYLPPFLNSERDGEANITHFIMETLSTAQTYQYSLYGEMNGILVAKVIDHIRDIFREIVGTSPIQFSAFRAKELEEALTSTGSDSEFDQRLVLNKPAWDFAMWLKERGVPLLGLSDRPDESTVSATGQSLLDVAMTIYGKEIASFLPNAGTSTEIAAAE
jgi:hypothetical protein